MAAAAAAAGATRSVKINGGLAGTVDLVDEGVKHIVVCVTRLEVCDASAILQVITSEINVLLRVVIPRLKISPTSAKDGRLLNRYGYSLVHAAKKVNGRGTEFHATVREVSDLLKSHAVHPYNYNEQKPTCDIEFLRDNLEVLEEKLSNLKMFVVDIPCEEATGAGTSGNTTKEAGTARMSKGKEAGTTRISKGKEAGTKEARNGCEDGKEKKGTGNTNTKRGEGA